MLIYEKIFYLCNVLYEIPNQGNVLSMIVSSMNFPFMKSPTPYFKISITLFALPSQGTLSRKNNKIVVFCREGGGELVMKPQLTIKKLPIACIAGKSPKHRSSLRRRILLLEDPEKKYKKILILIYGLKNTLYELLLILNLGRICQDSEFRKIF